jgi:uncharacterized protein (TIGR02001 family)
MPRAEQPSWQCDAEPSQSACDVSRRSHSSHIAQSMGRFSRKPRRHPSKLRRCYSNDTFLQCSAIVFAGSGTFNLTSVLGAMAKLRFADTCRRAPARRVSEKESDMRKSLSLMVGTAALGLASVAATPASAQIAGLSANAAVTSNYIFRGISQSGGNMAVQAGVDYAFGDTGLAIGAWASSIDFGNSTVGDDTPAEIDLYGSYTLAITEQLGLVVGGITYNYPSAPTGVNYNWYEVYAGLSYNLGVAALNGRVYYSPDYVNLSTNQWYLTGGVSVPLVEWLTLNGNIGYSTFDHAVPPIIEDYLDWNISAVATYGNFSLTAGYSDTDLEGIYEVTSGPFQTDGQFFFMIGFRLPAP